MLFKFQKLRNIGHIKYSNNFSHSVYYSKLFRIQLTNFSFVCLAVHYVQAKAHKHPNTNTFAFSRVQRSQR